MSAVLIPAKFGGAFPEFVIGFFIAAAQMFSVYFSETITPQQTADFLRPMR